VTAKAPLIAGHLLSLPLTAIGDVLILENRLLAIADRTHDLALGEAAGILFRSRDNADTGASRAAHRNSRDFHLAGAVTPIAKDEIHGDLSCSVASRTLRPVLTERDELLGPPFFDSYCVAAAIAFGAWVWRRADHTFSTAVWAKCRHDRNLTGKSGELSVTSQCAGAGAVVIFTPRALSLLRAWAASGVCG